MALTYFLCSVQSGEVLARLPLHEVRLSSSLLSPGQMLAKLDLRRTVQPTGERTWAWGEAATILDALRFGACTIVAAIENSTAGALDPVDYALGEWWVTGLSGSHADPVITLSGHELDEYFAHQTTSRDWDSGTGTVDAVWTAREIMHDATAGQTPPILLDVNRGSSSAITAATSWPARSLTVAEALRSLGAGTEWEQTIRSTMVSVDGIPHHVTRELILMAPRIELGVANLLPLEVTTPGSPPATGLDLGWSDDVESRASEMWSWGAGHGADQVRSGTTGTRPTGAPVLSRLVSDSSVRFGSGATALAVRAMKQMQRVPFTAVVRADRMTPQVGGRRWVSREPSLSMPTPEQFNARVTEWEWAEPQAGAPDVYAVTLERL